jgi:hypothetical protein
MRSRIVYMSYAYHRECWVKHIKRETKKESFYFFQNVDNHLPSYFLSKKFQLISEIRSLSADCLPSLIKASVCVVSASQLFGGSVTNLFNPLRNTEKNYEG